MERIDLKTWPRRELFELFSEMNYPFVNLSWELDVTELKAAAKALGCGFYHSCLYVCTRAANRVEPFLYRIRGKDVLRLDVGIADPNRYGGDVVCRVVRAADDTLVAIAKVNLVFFDYRGAKRPVPAPTQFTRAITGESRSD